MKTATIVVVAVLYGLGPLQKPLSIGFHKLEHAISNTSSDHIHSHELAHKHNLVHGHDHDHKVLTFFNKLFSEDPHSDEQAPKELNLDKHVLQDYTFKQTRFSPRKKGQFFFLAKHYGITLHCAIPPPRDFFS